MSRWVSQVSGVMDLDAYDNCLERDAAPEPIEDKETAPVEYCEACGCPEDDGKPCVGSRP